MDNPVYLKIQDFIVIFRGILFEAMPWVVIGAVFAGLVQDLPTRRAPAVMLSLGLLILLVTVLPLPLEMALPIALVVSLAVAGLMVLAQAHVDGLLRFLARHRFLSIAMSGFLGLVNPMCDCGVIVVMRRLLRKGLPLSCCVTYILAGPIINVLVMATTYQAFFGQDTKPGAVYQMGSWWMLGLRMALGYLVAMNTGFVVEWLHRRYGNSLVSPSLLGPGELNLGYEEGEEEGVGTPITKRLANISETALHDFVDVMALLIPGALFAAFVRQVISPDQFERMSLNNPSLAIVSMIGLAFLITLCSEADAFVAATFAVRPAAKLAFLVFGPMLDLKLFFMYTRVFRPRLMWTIILCIFTQVLVYSLVVHFLWETYAPVYWKLIAPNAATLPIP